MKALGTIVALLGMLLFYYSIYRIIRKAIHRSKNPAEKWKTPLLMFGASILIMMAGGVAVSTQTSTTPTTAESSSSKSPKKSSSSHHKAAKKKMTEAEKASSRKASSSESASESADESAALSSSSAEASSSSAKAAAKAGKMAKINSGIAASLKEDQNWAAGGKSEYDWSTYVISIKLNSKRQLAVQVKTKVKILTQDAIKELANSSQNLAITVLMEQDQLKPGEDTDGLFTNVKSGVVAVAQSHLTDYHDIKVYLKN